MGEKNLEQVAWIDLGRMDYQTALERQAALAGRVEADRAAGASGRAGWLLTVEHDPVLTVGRKAEPAELGLEEANWTARGVQVLRSNRGGRVTYHGPGQLVVYPILDLERFGRDLHRYIRLLEESAIRYLAGHGIEAHRDPRDTGAWVGEAKFAAIGVHTRRWISTHGMALNLDPDLTVYRDFIPCGIRDRGVTSLARLLGHRIDFPTERKRYLDAFAEVFNVKLRPA